MQILIVKNKLTINRLINC